MKHLSCEAQKKAIIKLMTSSSSLAEWKHNAETIQKLYHGVLPQFWTRLLYEKPNGETQSVFEKTHARWQIRAAGKSARHQ